MAMMFLYYGNENLGGKCVLIALKIMSQCKQSKTRLHFLYAKPNFLFVSSFLTLFS